MKNKHIHTTILILLLIPVFGAMIDFHIVYLRFARKERNAIKTLFKHFVVSAGLVFLVYIISNILSYYFVNSDLSKAMIYLQFLLAWIIFDITLMKYYKTSVLSKYSD